MKELEDFYTLLYKNSESRDCDRRFQDFLNGDDIPTLATIRKIYAKDFWQTVEFPNGKTTGNDGLTPDFHKKF